jgi:ribosomal protein L32
MLDFICPKCGYLGLENSVCESCGSSIDGVTEDSQQ